MIDVTKPPRREMKAASKDLVGIFGVSHEMYDAGTNTYPWIGPYGAESWTDFDLAMGDVGAAGSIYVAHFRIQNRYADRRWKIHGEVLPNTGDWTIKIRVGNSLADSVEYSPPVQFAEWEQMLPALGENNAVWVWHTAYVHSPANPKGITVHNSARVRTMDV